VGRTLLRDPWAARNDYGAVMGDRSPESLSAFFAAHQRHELSAAERVQALQLLEMQRHAMFMYTSCGWFFDEISRPEGTQILRYAARAIELAGEVTGIALESGVCGSGWVTPPATSVSLKMGPGFMKPWCAPPAFP
jgi:alpha-amylase/alpha-mannosidase (GH57 family)